jgi:hypothetical protein
MILLWKFHGNGQRPWLIKQKNPNLTTGCAKRRGLFHRLTSLRGLILGGSGAGTNKQAPENQVKGYAGFTNHDGRHHDTLIGYATDPSVPAQKRFFVGLLLGNPRAIIPLVQSSARNVRRYALCWVVNSGSSWTCR